MILRVSIRRMDPEGRRKGKTKKNRKVFLTPQLFNLSPPTSPLRIIKAMTFFQSLAS